METKSALQSKTIRSIIVLVAILLMNILGVGESTPGKTYDTMLEMEGRKTEQIKNLLMLGAAGGAAYGRTVADKPLGRKKKRGKNEKKT